MKNEYLGGSREIWDIYSQILKIINLNPDDKILDAGCGKGLFANYFRGENLYGIDLNPKNVKKAKTKNYREVRIGSVLKLPYKDKSFDKTICMEVIQFIDNPKQLLKELLRVTKKEIIITSPNQNFSLIRTLFKGGRNSFIDGLQERHHFFVNQFLFEKLAKDNNLHLQMKYLSKTLGIIRNLKIIGNLWGGEIIGIFKIKDENN